MNKSELIEAIAKSADISKASAEKALDGALNAISGSLKKGSNVTLVGFGIWAASNRIYLGSRLLLVVDLSPGMMDAANYFRKIDLAIMA